MAKWVCKVCGYIHEGDTPPERCPQCGVPADKFEKVEETSTSWATEHVVGVAKSDIPAERRMLRGGHVSCDGKSRFP